MKIFYFSNKLSVFSKYFEVSAVIEPRTAMNSLIYWTDIQSVMVKKRGHLPMKMSLFLCGGPRALLWGMCAWYHEKRGYRVHFYLESARGTFMLLDGK